jgi:hypothetical protein
VAASCRNVRFATAALNPSKAQAGNSNPTMKHRTAAENALRERLPDFSSSQAEYAPAVR